MLISSNNNLNEAFHCNTNRGTKFWFLISYIYKPITDKLNKLENKLYCCSGTSYDCIVYNNRYIIYVKIHLYSIHVIIYTVHIINYSVIVHIIIIHRYTYLPFHEFDLFCHRPKVRFAKILCVYS